MNDEWPMLTSTLPRELFRPMTMRFWRTRYSNSRPSIRAMASPLSSGLHCTLEGLAGADFRDSKVHASLSDVWEKADMTADPHYTGALGAQIVHWGMHKDGGDLIVPLVFVAGSFRIVVDLPSDFITARSVFHHGVGKHVRLPYAWPWPKDSTSDTSCRKLALLADADPIVPSAAIWRRQSKQKNERTEFFILIILNNFLILF